MDQETRPRFVHIEPRLSLTGAKADEWIPITECRSQDWQPPRQWGEETGTGSAAGQRAEHVPVPVSGGIPDNVSFLSNASVGIIQHTHNIAQKGFYIL